MTWNGTTREQHGCPLIRFETDLTDEERDLVFPLLPEPCGRGRPRKTDLRGVFDAIRHMLGTGCKWRAIPQCFPPSATVRSRCCAWRDRGMFEAMLDALRGHAREVAGRFGEPTAAATDSQSAKTAESGGPAGCDAGRKARGRKRHITVDVEGFPVTMEVHAADAQDRDGAPSVILGKLEKAPAVWRLRADGGCQGPKLASRLGELGLGGILEIVERPKEIRGFTVPCRRRVVERTFGWMSR